MQFYLAQGAIRETNRGDTLQLPPSAASVRLTEAREDVFDWAQNLKLHLPPRLALSARASAPIDFSDWCSKGPSQNNITWVFN